MAIDNWVIRLNKLVKLYEEGLYTKPEVIGSLLDLFDKKDNKEFWLEIPTWAKKELVDSVETFDETEDFILIRGGHNEKEKYKNKILLIKSSMKEMGVIN